MTRIHDLIDRADPYAPAVSDSLGTAWSYGDLARASREAAAALTAHGVRSGDRVLIVAENCAVAVAWLYGASRAGAWAVPVNARMTAHELGRIVDHAGPRVGVFTSGVSDAAAAHGARLGAKGDLAVLAGSDPAEAPGIAAMLYTTGTTGAPKGVMLSHGNLLFAGNASATIRGMGPGDLVYGGLPMTHVFGLASMVVAAASGGAAIRLVPRFTAEGLYAALQDGVTVLPAVPQMHALLMAHVQARGHGRLEGTGLRYVSSGAAPLDPVWKRKAEAFYGIPLQNGYGMTESTAGVCSTLNALGDPDISVGQPLAGVEVRIDESVPGGGDGAGEVCTRGPHVMAGYYRAPRATAECLDEGGWLHTGDLGRIDAEGRLHILGRSKELIIRGGFNVYPPEVEAALNDHPDVVQSAVIGRASGGDEEVLAFVQAARPVGEATLAAFVAERLAGYKRPARIVVADALPAAPTGKILKHRLLETFGNRL